MNKPYTEYESLWEQLLDNPAYDCTDRHNRTEALHNVLKDWGLCARLGLDQVVHDLLHFETITQAKELIEHISEIYWDDIIQHEVDERWSRV